ncbi:hypothetical protein [Citrobacter rodentium]|uniref:Hypothetical prophage protein n=1 Tax=Citrobacter rodentium (strain ICC168) TaxID=637910 RepID=D2TUS9_CITRI|nr:hypothetical protein [Citrobacter rodentium]WOZ57192.1 alpha-2,3-sialyltransferase [Citrobacter phage phiNP]CBG89348.1 hypothetical prophage protein [Citrobacter rodentium ICC168]
MTIIAVNGAIDWLPSTDYFFTLDPSPENMSRLANPRPNICYVAAVPDDIGLPPHVIRMRRISSRGAEPATVGSPGWWLWRWSCTPGLSNSPGEIHSGNSAYGALGLAYHLGFIDVALVGVDATDEERVEGGWCRDLSHLPLLFASARPQINVVSLGKLASVPQMTLAEWMDMTDER